MGTVGPIQASMGYVPPSKSTHTRPQQTEPCRSNQTAALMASPQVHQHQRASKAREGQTTKVPLFLLLLMLQPGQAQSDVLAWPG